MKTLAKPSNPSRNTWITIGVLTLLFFIGKSLGNR